VSLDIFRSCVTALIGPSGCGKSSFLSSLNRLSDLIPGCEVEGRILVARIFMISSPMSGRCGVVGMIFQRPNPFRSPSTQS
jgi:phosphate transport system ATP-binding protein